MKAYEKGARCRIGNRRSRDRETRRRLRAADQRHDDAVEDQRIAAFAAELERRLGLDAGAVEVVKINVEKRPLVYLAHGSEDKEAIVRPRPNASWRKGSMSGSTIGKSWGR